MRRLFAGAFVCMALLSVVAWRWGPTGTPGRTKLVWVCDDAPSRREQIALFNKLHPEYELVLDPDNGGLEKVTVQCIAGVGPDLFDCYVPYQLSLFVRSGIARDITDDVKVRGIDMDETWPCLKSIYSHDGRIYAHPGNASANAIWYNKRLFDEAGAPYPKPGWTWDDFVATAQKLTKRDAAGHTQQFGFVGYFDWRSVLYEFGGRMFTPELTRCSLDSPQAISAFAFLQDLTFKYHVMPSLSEETFISRAGGWGATQDVMLTAFAGERGAMAIGGRWWLVLLRKPEYAHLELGAAPMPEGPGHQTVGGGRATIVNANGKNIKGALAFIEFLHSKEWSDLVNARADALAPVKKYNYTDTFLHNPDFPKEDFNEVWRAALEHAIPDDDCPYVNGARLDRIIKDQTDLIRLNQKPAEQTVREMTRLINHEIVLQLRQDPGLKERYLAQVAKGARPAWDRPEDAP